MTQPSWETAASKKKARVLYWTGAEEISPTLPNVTSIVYTFITVGTKFRRIILFTPDTLEFDRTNSIVKNNSTRFSHGLLR